LIPSNILSSFDFNTYPVSKLGYREINQNYDLPILEIKYEKEIVLKNDGLFSLLVILFWCIFPLHFIAFEKGITFDV
jgi:hypothetical protein